VRFVARLSFAVALLISTLFAQEAQKPAPDRDAFTFLNWNLELRIETKTESLFVRGKITMRNDSTQPQRQLALQVSSSLKWASIKQGDDSLAFTASQLRSDLDHSGNVQEAIVSLPSAVGPGASIELEVGYSGTVSLDTTRLAQLGVPLAVRAATDYDRITPTFTCLRGVGHVLWFPVSLQPAVLSEGNRVFEETSAWAVRHSLSTMKLDVPIDASVHVYGNAQGILENYVGLAPGSHSVLEWKHLGLSGPVVVAAPYQGLIARHDPAAVFNVSFFPEHEAQAQDYARVVRDTPSMVSGKSGVTVFFLELPEAPDTTFDADSVLLMPFKPTDRKSLEVTIAYMLAHQTLWSQRAWVYAGAAHLAQVLMRERQDGRAAAIAFMEQRLSPLVLVDSEAPDTEKNSSLINTRSEVFYRTKAMYVWWMLKEIVGQRALLDSFEQYDPDADKESSYLQKLLENNSHKDLEWFFDDWVYRDRGLPEFTISNGYARPSLQGIYLVSATIENKGAAAAEVPVIVHTQTGDVVSRLRVPGHGKNAARIEVGSKPIDVTVNDGSIPEADRSDNTAAVRIGAE
jgi:hypothetical protein